MPHLSIPDDEPRLAYLVDDGLVISRRHHTPAEALDLLEQLDALREQILDAAKPTLGQRLRELADFLDSVGVGSADRIMVTVHGGLHTMSPDLHVSQFAGDQESRINTVEKLRRAAEAHDIQVNVVTPIADTPTPVAAAEQAVA